MIQSVRPQGQVVKALKNIAAKKTFAPTAMPTQNMEKTKQAAAKVFAEEIARIQAKPPQARNIAEKIQLASYNTAKMLLSMPQVIMR